MDGPERLFLFPELVSLPTPEWLMRLHARPVVSFLSLPGALVELYLFPYLCSFELIYVNSYFFALGTSSPLPSSWHVHQLILSSSGKFVADVLSRAVRTSKVDRVRIR